MAPALRQFPLHLFLAVYLSLGAIGHIDILRLVLHPGGGLEQVAPAGKAPPAKPRPALVQARHLSTVVKVAAVLVPSVIRYQDPGIRPLFIVSPDRESVHALDPVLLPSRPRDPPQA